MERLWELLVNIDFGSLDDISVYYMTFSILFLEFIEGVSQFSVKGDKESKLKCKFSCI